MSLSWGIQHWCATGHQQLGYAVIVCQAWHALESAGALSLGIAFPKALVIHLGANDLGELASLYSSLPGSCEVSLRVTSWPPG